MNIVRCSSICIHIYVIFSRCFETLISKSAGHARKLNSTDILLEYGAYFWNSQSIQHTLNKPSQRNLYSICNSQSDLANYNWGCGHWLTTITNQDHISIEIEGKGSIINTYWNSKVTAGKESASHPSLRATQSVPVFIKIVLWMLR